MKIFLSADVMHGSPSETPSKIDETVEFVAALFDEAVAYTNDRKAGTLIAEIIIEWEVDLA